MRSVSCNSVSNVIAINVRLSLSLMLWIRHARVTNFVLGLSVPKMAHMPLVKVFWVKRL